MAGGRGGLEIKTAHRGGSGRSLGGRGGGAIQGPNIYIYIYFPLITKF
jgi:hypothetical protein